MKIKFFTLTAVTLVISLMAGCGGSTSKGNASADSTEVSIDSVSGQDNSESTTISVVDEKELPKVIDFNAVWCGPCQQMKPIFESLAETYEGRAVFQSVDVDENPVLAEKYGITAIPAFVFLDKDGNEVNRIVGAAPESELVKVLESLK